MPLPYSIATVLFISLFLATVSCRRFSCQSTECRDRCSNTTCEFRWVACSCPNGLHTGYHTPCCRDGDDCIPCSTQFSGCDLYKNCRDCVIGVPDQNVLSDRNENYCNACNKGWFGNTCTECGKIYNGNSGVIEILGYPNNADCVWTIGVTRTSTVELSRFERFHLESGIHCSYDNLTIYDGGDAPEAVVMTLCGHVPPRNFVSKFNVIILKFKSDDEKNFDGFRITYTKLSACAANPCLNGGTCMVVAPTRFNCICEIGYYGEHCEFDVKANIDFLGPMLQFVQPVAGGLINLLFVLSGLTVTYGCDVGYVLEGSHRSRCLRNGNWDLNPPTCGWACRDAPFLSLSGRRSNLLETVNREKRERALVSNIGLSRARKQERREKGARQFKALPPSRENGRTRIKFSCMFPDLRIVGVKLRVCLEDGSWSGTRNPLCLPRCGLFPMTSEILGTVPWHVTILRRNTVTNRWHPVCNGAFIGDNLIITSAQCVTYSFTNLKYNVSSMVVGIGDVTRTVIRHKYHVSNLKISRILIHHNYDPMLRHNDVALLVMTSSVPIDFSGEIWPICL
uniref:Inactive serine protease PAMR1 n=1 Tax=Ciona intestinalis TaxID=7719 RepID=F6XIW9_CIOIN